MSFFAEPCWLQSSFPHTPYQPLAGQGVDAADTAAAGIDTATASGADIGVEFVCTAAAGSDTLSPAVGGFGSTDADPDCSISTLELGGWKHSLLRSTKACHTCFLRPKPVSADGRSRLAGSSAVDVGRHVLSSYLHLGWALLAAMAMLSAA